jgi:hypothetical protein
VDYCFQACLTGEKIGLGKYTIRFVELYDY